MFSGRKQCLYRFRLESTAAHVLSSGAMGSASRDAPKKAAIVVPAISGSVSIRDARRLRVKNRSKEIVSKWSTKTHKIYLNWSALRNINKKRRSQYFREGLIRRVRNTSTSEVSFKRDTYLAELKTAATRFELKKLINAMFAYSITRTAYST